MAQPDQLQQKSYKCSTWLSRALSTKCKCMATVLQE